MRPIYSACLIAFIWSFADLVWAKEALMVEGSMGQSSISIFSPQDTEVNIKGFSSLLRFHFAILDKKNHIIALTLSNQIFQGKVYQESTDQTQSLSFSGIGAGLSYRFLFFIVGAEYQQASMSQLTVGTSPADHFFSANIPHLYGGLFHKFGNLGFALIYSQKEVSLSAAKTGLAIDRPYRETTGYFSLTYHFDGSTANFFRSLFQK